MKVKALSRSLESHTRERIQDIHKVQRNLDPALHPFEKAREYTRALNAVKLERMFAKPFVASLSGHIDGVYSMSKHPSRLDTLVSGSGDGEIRVWNLTDQEITFKFQSAHRGIVKGICCSPTESDTYFSCGSDKTVKIWRPSTDSSHPINVYSTSSPLTGISHHRREALFATSGSSIDIWDENRSEPIKSFSWGADTINTVRFNQTEVSVLASCGADRSIILYDLRMSQTLAKLITTMRTNAIAWNPMEAYIFTAANEDHNCYTFDMRKMDIATNVLKDHVSAVLDVDYAPTGAELVTGSYDRSLRIFSSQSGRSRDIYHTKRMQRVFCVQFSADSRFILSGSDDGNIRVWKARASEKLSVKDIRERTRLEYNEKLKERFSEINEIKKIARHRNIPKDIKTATARKRIMIESRKKKEQNMRKHMVDGSVPYTAERKKGVVGIAK